MGHLPENPSRDAIIKAILNSDPSRDWESAHLGNQKTTYFTNNVHLRFESGEGEYFDGKKKFKASWLKPAMCQGPGASISYFYLFYGATLLKKFTLVAVDDGRALVPMPHGSLDALDSGKLFVSQLECQVARIHSCEPDCDRYVRQFGFTIEDN